MWFRPTVIAALAAGASILTAQTQPEAQTQPPQGQTQAAAEDNSAGWRKLQEPAKPGQYVIPAQTKIPLNLINSVSTKHSAPGDRVYLVTAFPILANGKIVIPPGSYVAGTITEVKQPGRVKGRGELYLRFDSLTLPNGVTRDFRARIGGLDGRSNEELDRKEGKVVSEGNKSGDARTIGEATAAGTSIGVIAGSAAGRPGLGAGMGAAAGAAAGLMGVLLSRGPDAVLSKGMTIEMVLDRPLSFDEKELVQGPMPAVTMVDSGTPVSEKSKGGVPIPGRRFPW